MTIYRDNIEPQKETIRIDGKKIKFNLKIFSGKEGDIFVIVSPTILVSGYGTSEDEASESFRANLILFCQDIWALDRTERDRYIKSLGFQKVDFRPRNFTNLFKDTKGVLDDIDQETIKSEYMEMAV